MLTDQIRQFLYDEYNEGATQKEMAALHHVSQPYIQRLLSGARQCSGLTVGVVDKMFPHATVNLRGDTVKVNADHNRGNVVGINRGLVGTDYLSAVIDKILASEELSSDEKIKMSRAIKK